MSNDVVAEIKDHVLKLFDVHADYTWRELASGCPHQCFAKDGELGVDIECGDTNIFVGIGLTKEFSDAIRELKEDMLINWEPKDGWSFFTALSGYPRMYPKMPIAKHARNYKKPRLCPIYVVRGENWKPYGKNN